MTHSHFFKKSFKNCLTVFAAAVTLTACVDDSYDLDKDIDMTVGLGANGLQLKLGTTEKVTLDDLLEADKENMLGTTADHIYYLTNSGSSDFNIHVDDVQVKINQATLTPEIEVLPPVSIATTLPQGELIIITVR